jgi:hypothetical protein
LKNDNSATWNLGGEKMINKLAIISFVTSVLVFTSAYAQDLRNSWRDSPLKSKTSNQWRKKPYTSGTSDSWRKSPLHSNDSELRWNRKTWEKSRLNWRDSNTSWDKKNWQKRSTNWRNSPNRWNKDKWQNNPLNWRNSDLEWKNSRRKYNRGSTQKEIKEWESPNVKTPPDNTDDQKEATKAEEGFQPRIEIIEVDDNLLDDAFTEAIDYSSGKTNSIMMYGSQGVKVVKQNEPGIKKFNDDSIVIFGSDLD